jgi:hypothetical protein
MQNELWSGDRYICTLKYDENPFEVLRMERNRYKRLCIVSVDGGVRRVTATAALDTIDQDDDEEDFFGYDEDEDDA